MGVTFRRLTDDDLPMLHGWLQTYPLAVDDPAERGRGLGPVIIRTFVDDIVFGRHPWPQACAGPHPDNRASWRALEKVGFRLAGLIDTEEGRERLMVIDHTIGR